MLFGSFGNACIYRWPLEESVSRGRSACPHCHAVIRWFDNIPVLSWVLLAGRCRSCRGPVSIRYPFVELLMGVGTVASFTAFPERPLDALAAAVFVWALIVSFFIDWDFRIIPNEVTIPLAVVGVLAAPFLEIASRGSVTAAVHFIAGFEPPGPVSSDAPADAFFRAIAGYAVGFGALYLVRIAGQKIYGQEAMGMGDVKFLGLVGAWLGAEGAVRALFLGAIAGGLVSIPLLVLRRVGRKSYIPFGPFLALGAFIALFEGRLWTWPW
jgi:leader peptidase (prepilin peptidase) / N-methyltransferase